MNKEFIKQIAEPINKLTLPIASATGKTLEEMWSLVFGGFDVYVEKKKVVRQKCLDDFKKSLYKNISKIPEENLQEPSLSIVGPALESSKYYFEEKELREMFAKLIARSMDSTQTSKIHPSFVDIIKQLCPLDAKNFSIINSKISCPLAEYIVHADFGDIAGQKEYKTNVFLSNPDCKDVDIQAASITLLERLGLVVTTYNNYLNDNSHYKIFELDPTFIFINFMVQKQEHMKKVTLHKGEVNVTPYGKNFAKICIDD